MMERALKEFENTYSLAADEIRAEINTYADAGGLLTLDVLQQVLEHIHSRLNRLAVDRNRILEDSLLDAADIGVSPFQGVQAITTTLPAVATSAAQFTATFTDAGGMNLSKRLWRIDNHARDAVSKAVQNAVVKGWSSSKAAEDFIARGVSVPGNVAKQIRSASVTTVGRSVTEALMTGEGNPYANARRVFRTEINRAHGEAFRASAFAIPDVIGTRFLLSPNHPRVDICDMHARVNRYGLGNGVYPKGKSPWPAHPNTLSFENIVFKDEISAEDRAGKEDRITWLKKQTAAVQEGVVGSKTKRAALIKDLLKESQIATPLKVLKKRWVKQGIDVEALEI